MNTPPKLTSEALLADQLAVPRAKFTAWRKSGKLRYPSHFVTQGRGEIMLTEAGLACVEQLLKLEKDALVSTPEVQVIKVKVTRITANPRLLMARRADGARVHVRIITPRVFARHFAVGAVIEVRPLDVSVVEFHGKPSKKRNFQ